MGLLVLASSSSQWRIQSLSDTYYFTNDGPIESIGSVMLQLTLLFLVFGSMPFITYSMMRTMSSPQLDEDTRMWQFIRQLSSSIPIGFLLAVLMSTYDLDWTGFNVPIQETNITLSLPIFATIFIYLVITIVLPYIVVSEAGAACGSTCSSESGIGRAMPSTSSARRRGRSTSQRSRSSSAAIQEQLELYISSQPLMDVGLRYEDGADLDTIAEEVDLKPHQIAFFSPTFYQLSRDMDPRFEFYDYAVRFLARLQDIAGDMAQRRSRVSKERAGEVLAKVYQNERAELDAMIDKSMTTKPLLIAGLGILTPIVSALMGEVAKGVWEMYLKDYLK